MRTVTLLLLAACGSDPEPTSEPVHTPDTDTDTDTDVPTTPVDTATFSDGGHTVTVTVEDRDSLARTYALTTTQPLRDGVAGELTVVEEADGPVLRSGSDLFDALFAMAVQEARQASVSEITDGAFADGSPLPCDCFETGEKWPFVWTRDTAYAVDLGLAWLDPERARDSLLFKLSAPKAGLGTGLRIVQDTGTGGSWPVSTDRVVWAIGARATLAHLHGADRDAFRDVAYEALVNTIADDRDHVWDPDSGLYRGEQSFLDWREQSYPSWTAADTVHIGMSEALSTNVGHLEALRLAADLAAELGDPAEATWRLWADDLAAAIDAGFWRDDLDGWSTLRTTWLDRAPVDGRDLLGTSLAALALDGPDHAERAVASYPFAHPGPPVIWPQQPLIPIYHNRGIWPFVTAYAARAAASVGNAAVFDRAAFSLVRGAALNLSNMENLEFLTGLPWVDDGEYSGPVVNSRRQLWSVGGYLGLVLEIVGVHPDEDGLTFAPFVTPEVHATWLAGSERVTLHRVPFHGVTFDLVLELPELGSGGAYAVAEVAVDGVPVSRATAAELDGAEVVVTLAAGDADAGTVVEVVDDGDYTKIYAPREPSIVDLRLASDRLVLELDANGEAGVAFDVYRDGVLVAEDVTSPWTDTDSADHASRSYCYAAASRFPGSGHRSQHSPPSCWWGPGGERVQTVSAYGIVTEGGAWSTDHGQVHHGDWGAPDHVLTVPAVRPAWSGEYLLQPVYGNGAGPVSTGVTAGHKWVTVREAATGAVVAEGPWVMPQAGSWAEWRDGSFVRATLDAGTTYAVEVTDAPNASHLAAFELYTAGLGGGPEPYNFVNLAEIKLLPLSGVDETPATGTLVPLDGTDDLGAFDPAQVLVPGAPLVPWSGFALDWDADWLYLAVVTSAFEDPWAPFVLYLEATSGPPGPAAPGAGMLYDGLTPELPFTPTHAVSFRQTSDDGTGPFNGVRRWDGSSWVLQGRLEPGVTEWLAGDLHTLAVKVPRALLGDPTHLRLAGHVVWAEPANEWKETVPSTHTPWAASAAGFYELDLAAPGGVGSWTLR